MMVSPDDMYSNIPPVPTSFANHIIAWLFQHPIKAEKALNYENSNLVDL